MFHSEALVVGGDSPAGDSLNTRMAPLDMGYQLQHVFDLIALRLAIGQVLHTSDFGLRCCLHTGHAVLYRC